MKKLMILLLSVVALSAFAQPAQRMIKVQVTPSAENWVCKTGEKTNFDISVTQNGQALKDAEIRYELSEDMLEPYEKKTTVAKNGELKISGVSMKQAGFLRCRAFVKYDNMEYEGRATVGFSPEKITPTTKMPADFNEFWNKEIEKAKRIQLDSRMLLLPERCTDKVNVYEVSFQNESNGSRIYGVLCVPKAAGKYPALLKVPGAGVRSYYGDVNNASKGIITLEIGIHGLPVTLDTKVYDNLRAGALSRYWDANSTSKDNMYYKRVFTGCVKAIDYIFSLPEFDGTNLVVAGGSQGGALAIITAGLDSRVTGLVSFYPAMSDMNGYLYNRAGGWPHAFKNLDKSSILTKEKESTMAYFDVVNFARLVKVPAFYSFGYNDMVCSPTTSFAVYNTLQSTKTVNIVPEIEHYTYPEMWNKAWKWADEILKVK